MNQSGSVPGTMGCILPVSHRRDLGAQAGVTSSEAAPGLPHRVGRSCLPSGRAQISGGVQPRLAPSGPRGRPHAVPAAQPPQMLGLPRTSALGCLSVLGAPLKPPQKGLISTARCDRLSRTRKARSGARRNLFSSNARARGHMLGGHEPLHPTLVAWLGAPVPPVLSCAGAERASPVSAQAP